MNTSSYSVIKFCIFSYMFVSNINLHLSYFWRCSNDETLVKNVEPLQVPDCIREGLNFGIKIASGRVQTGNEYHLCVVQAWTNKSNNQSFKLGTKYYCMKNAVQYDRINMLQGENIPSLDDDFRAWSTWSTCYHHVSSGYNIYK